MILLKLQGICDKDFRGKFCEERNVSNLIKPNTCNTSLCNDRGLCEVMSDKRKTCKCYVPYYGFKCEKQFITKTPDDGNTQVINNKFLATYKLGIENTTMPSV